MDQKKLLSISTRKVCYFPDKKGKNPRRPCYTSDNFSNPVNAISKLSKGTRYFLMRVFLSFCFVIKAPGA